MPSLYWLFVPWLEGRELEEPSPSVDQWPVICWMFVHQQIPLLPTEQPITGSIGRHSAVQDCLAFVLISPLCRQWHYPPRVPSEFGLGEVGWLLVLKCKIPASCLPGCQGTEFEVSEVN